MTISNIRQLIPSDRTSLEAFLNGHPEQTVFLRHNLHRGGLDYTGKPGQSIYFGSVTDQQINAVISISWNGHIQLYAPQDMQPLCSALLTFLKESNRKVLGINGMPGFVCEALPCLHMQNLPKQLDTNEKLFTLDLEQLQLPSLLKNEGVHIREPENKDYETLVDWQINYALEALGAQKTEDLIKQTQIRVKNLIRSAGKDTRLLIVDGDPVSRTNFTASLPDCVMIGGVWTPSEKRNQGFARSVVAAHLMEVRKKGVGKAILFTNSPNAARAYEAIGFEHKDHYSMILLKEPTLPSQ